jgi:hypothetical protein
MENVKNNTMIQSLQVGMSIIDLVAIQENPLKFTEIQEQVLRKVIYTNI